MSEILRERWVIVTIGQSSRIDGHVPVLYTGIWSAIDGYSNDLEQQEASRIKPIDTVPQVQPICILIKQSKAPIQICTRLELSNLIC